MSEHDAEPLRDELGRTYEEAVRECFEDLVADHKLGKVNWRGHDPKAIAALLEEWMGGPDAEGEQHMAEAFWRYYEWANP